MCLVCAGPVMWTVIPGYDGMIDLFYREFADCGRHLCSSRSTLREWSTHECRVNLETSCQVVVNTRLVNVMMLLAYENCNIHNLKDVENTISLIEMWLTVLSTKGQMYVYIYIVWKVLLIFSRSNDVLFQTQVRFQDTT